MGANSSTAILTSSKQILNKYKPINSEGKDEKLLNSSDDSNNKSTSNKSANTNSDNDNNKSTSDNDKKEEEIKICGIRDIDRILDSFREKDRINYSVDLFNYHKSIMYDYLNPYLKLRERNSDPIMMFENLNRDGKFGISFEHPTPFIGHIKYIHFYGLVNPEIRLSAYATISEYNNTYFQIRRYGYIGYEHSSNLLINSSPTTNIYYIVEMDEIYKNIFVFFNCSGVLKKGTALRGYCAKSIKELIELLPSCKRNLIRICCMSFNDVIGNNKNDQDAIDKLKDENNMISKMGYGNYLAKKEEEKKVRDGEIESKSIEDTRDIKDGNIEDTDDKNNEVKNVRDVVDSITYTKSKLE